MKTHLHLRHADSHSSRNQFTEKISDLEHRERRSERIRPVSKPFAQKKRLRILWVCAIGYIAALLVVRPLLPVDTILHEILGQIGLLVLLAGIAGRLWSIIYVGGRKNRELVTLGPYSLTRNPLYASSMVAIAGATLMYGSIVLTMIFTAILFLVFYYTARREANYLKQVFGDHYIDYAASTPLFLPKIAAIRTDASSLFSPSVVRTTARDAIFFVALAPLIELIEQLHRHGLLPVLIVLP
jgi:protein-S-isoprenylcysteine O-methyltransferase Ste14